MDDAAVFKFLNEDGSAYHGGKGKWGLPKGDKPGAWKSVRGELVPCRNGLHLCRWQDLLSWPAPALFEAEYEGEMLDHGDKIVVRKARLLHRVEAWNERTMRLWACDCAEHVLPIYEKHHPKDEWPRNAIEVARRYANGGATTAELAAAWADARVAARYAAGAAAGAAARAAEGAAARAASWSAARAAARAAAWSAEGAAARAAAVAAEGAAARAASWSAARAAARAAAWSAEGAAARAAAVAAERTWQLDRLRAYLRGAV